MDYPRARRRYLAMADAVPHRARAMVLPRCARRCSSDPRPGTGDGRLLALLQVDRPDSLGADWTSPRTCPSARRRFAPTTRRARRARSRTALPALEKRFESSSRRWHHHLSMIASARCTARFRAARARRVSRTRALGRRPSLHLASSRDRRAARTRGAIRRLLGVETPLRGLREFGFEDVTATGVARDGTARGSSPLAEQVTRALDAHVRAARASERVQVSDVSSLLRGPGADRAGGPRRRSQNGRAARTHGMLTDIAAGGSSRCCRCPRLRRALLARGVRFATASAGAGARRLCHRVPGDAASPQ